jgi:glutathione S-transferase
MDMPNPHGLLLYDYAGSPCARRVRISLIEKGLEWDTETIDLSRMEQRHPDYLAINPNGLVPTLAHGERVVWESNVITQYLDDVFPERPLYGDDPWELAQVRGWQAAAQSMAKDFRPLMYQRLIGPVVRLKHTLDETLAIARLSTHSPIDLEWERKVWALAVLTPIEQQRTEERLLAWLDKLEHALEGRQFLVGDRFGQAEISVYPGVAMYPAVGLAIDARRHPNTCAWMRRLQRRPSFQRTLTKQDKGILALSRSGVLPWLARVVALPPQQQTVAQKLGLALLKKLLLRAERSQRSSARRAPLQRPRSGTIAPPATATRRLRPVERRLADAPYTLYQHAAAPECARVRWLMDELGLRYEVVDIGELPVLRHGERVIHDSAAIAEYLCAVAGDERWFPRDAHALARVRMWLAFDAAMHKCFDHGPEHSRALLGAKLDVVEAELSGRTFLLGDRPSFADLALHTRFSGFERLGVAVDAARWPRVAGWMEEVAARAVRPVEAMI